MRAIILIAVVLLLAACKKDDDPYEGLLYPSINPPSEAIPTSNFAWLHQKIFRPTCAESGCHDGTFEPEFRTIGSAYNSLVYHPVISNDAGLTYTYRVLPGNVSLSLLHARLTTFIPNTSGQMPLEYDPMGDWAANSTYYIQQIDDWINAGAKDMFGNSPTLGNLEPQVTGMMAFPAGNTTLPYPRGTGSGVQPIEVPAAGVDLWFSISDDSTAANAITYNKLKISTQQFDFSSVPEQDLVISGPINGLDFSNASTTFTHKAALSLGAYPVGSYLFVRVYINDGDHTVNTEIPDSGTGEPMLSYFTLLIVP